MSEKMIRVEIETKDKKKSVKHLSNCAYQLKHIMGKKGGK